MYFKESDSRKQELHQCRNLLGESCELVWQVCIVIAVAIRFKKGISAGSEDPGFCRPLFYSPHIAIPPCIDKREPLPSSCIVANDHGEKPMKRQRLDGHRHPLQKRTLAVPTSEEEWKKIQGENAYSKTEDWFQDLLFPQRVRRPFPSSSVLSSIIAIPGDVATKRPRDAPLLKEFYDAVGVDLASKDDETDEIDENEAKEDIDNPQLSNLTLGQHQRFLQLTSSQQTERRKESERKELKSLRKVVLEEQSRYREAVDKFFSDHKDRFLLGFRGANHPASAFSRWASSNQRTMNERLKRETSLPSHFGKCRQIISLPSDAVRHMDIDSLQFKVVHRTQVADMGPSTLPSINTLVAPPQNDQAPTVSFLKDDRTGHQVAKEHKASILTTSDTLEALLQLPGQYDSRWITYTSSIQQDVSGDSPLAILDAPIAQPLLPRKCLEIGFREGLQQLIRPGDQASDSFQYTYTLWTLPANNSLSRRTPVRVLVRTVVRSVDQDGNPISIRPHVEYFPERGIEEPTIYEKSVWILDQLLFEHKVKAHFVRIHAQTCKVLKVEETSVAHAFAEATDKSSNPLLHWEALVQVLNSIPTIDVPNFLMCLPSQDPQSSVRSASVHAPLEGVGSKNSLSAAVDLEPILEQADTVVLNTEALRHCSLHWKWQSDERIPFTFPVRHKDRGKKKT
eukprot:scaffold22593_cov145-Cylindrotheca_fusiformis.AAC.11